MNRPNKVQDWAVFDPNQPLQLTAGIYGFSNVFGVAVGFGWSNVFRQPPAAPEFCRQL